MRFERRYSILEFAGNTVFSYPFMLQTNNIMTKYFKISRGAIIKTNHETQELTYDNATYHF